MSDNANPESAKEERQVRCILELIHCYTKTSEGLRPLLARKFQLSDLDVRMCISTAHIFFAHRSANIMRGEAGASDADIEVELQNLFAETAPKGK